MPEASIGLSFTEWALGVISTLVGIIFWFTHAKIDKNTAAIKDYKEEVKDDLMKNDVEHAKFWDLHNKADETRQDKYISRIEYEKDLKHISDAVTRIEGYTQITTKLLTEHMGKDK